MAQGKLDGEIAGWIHGELHRAALLRAGAIAREHAAVLLPIKGIALGLAYGREQRLRTMRDADCIVTPARSFQEVVHALRRSSEFAIETGGYTTVGLRWKQSPAYLDLHRHPLPLAFGTLRGDQILRRAEVVPQLGPNLPVPSRLDLLAITIGNFVKDGFGAIEQHGDVTGDLAVLITSTRELPGCAEHLRRVGMRRIALAACVALRSDWTMAVPLESLLSMSRAETRGIERRVAYVRSRGTEQPKRAYWVVRSIGDSPMHELRGAMLTGLRFGRDALRSTLRPL